MIRKKTMLAAAVILAMLIMLTACSGKEKIECKDYQADNCPEECTVCPPCAYCSSISCQTEEFCNSIGFDDDWWESVRPK